MKIVVCSQRSRGFHLKKQRQICRFNQTYGSHDYHNDAIPRYNISDMSQETQAMLFNIRGTNYVLQFLHNR